MISPRVLAVGVACAALVGSCGQPEAATSSPASTKQTIAASDQAEPAVAEATSGFASETKTFRDWTAVCDNVNNCTAYGPAEEQSGVIMVKLAAGPDARPSVYAGSWSLSSGSERILLDIDGLNYAGKMDRVDSENPLLKIERASDQLIRAIANGRAMTLSANGETAAVSLNGAAAALLWIDERQGRLGTSTALIRKGDRPASAVPAAPQPPRVVAAPRVAQTQLPKAMLRSVSSLPAVQDCARVNAEDISRDENYDVHRLGPDTLLWSVPCGSGAYNFSRLWLTSSNDGSRARVVSFPTSEQPEQTLVNSSFDPASNALSAFSKGRGIGDCGSMASWVWTGSAFVLKSEDMMGDCLGLHWELWPSTWRTAG